MNPPALSLCIPTMGRWNFLKQNIPEYLKNPYLTEIVICDETGEDAREIQACFDDPRIKVHVNAKRLGPYLNKYKVVGLARNDWVCLMDSDNFAPISYFDAWAKFLANREPNRLECFFPSKALPSTYLNYSEFIGTPITQENYKHMWKIPRGDAMFNTGNYIIPKDLYLRSVSTPELSKYDESCFLDVQFRNYFLLMNGATFHIVPQMEYSHVVHDGSFYINTHKLFSREPFDALYV
jgi:hypothetical protein